MKIPRRLSILGQEWSVELASGLVPTCLGVTIPGKNLIQIRKDLNREQIPETFFHEVFHAALYVSGICNITPIEEQLVTLLSPVLCATVRDNKLAFHDGAMKIPRKVDILCQRWDIVRSDTADFTDDAFNPETNEIYIPRSVNPQQVPGLFLHALMRACLYVSGICTLIPSDLEEQIITLLSPVLYSVLRKNKLNFAK